MTARRGFRRAIGSAVLLVTIMATPVAPRAAVLDWQACPAAAKSGQSAAVMRCGVFEPGDALAGAPVRIHFARLQARPDRPTPHPVVYVPGGPGDPGGLTPAALDAWRGFQQRAGWPRDLVIFDPRGTGSSTPRPACPEPSPPGAKHSGLAACFRALGKTTAARLGGRAQVADLHRLIAALDQGSAILWAESYGALIARRLAAQYPNDVRMMVLESPVLDPASIAARRASAFKRRRQQLIGECDRHPACRLATPSLGFVIDGLIAALRAQPVVVDPAVPPRRARPVEIDGRRMRDLLLLSAYQDASEPRVARLLRHALTDASALAPLATPLLALNERAPRTAPVYWSTHCQFTPRGGAARAATPCAQWPVTPLARLSTARVVPTLVVAGSRDVLTSAQTAVHAVLARPGWQFLPVANAAHGMLRHDPCAQRVVARFIDSGGAWLGSLRCTPGPNRAFLSERRSNDAATVSR